MTPANIIRIKKSLKDFKELTSAIFLSVLIAYKMKQK